ncbi:MAG TPA: proton-conducting transporter membrane subunit [Verrucomicrobiae bacterium]|nr:proton-conducting transporter membrane subunit [Verrucomicrobiae bacterium]
MTVLPFLLVAAVGGTVSLIVRGSRGWSTAVAVGALLGMAVTAMAMSPTATIDIGGAVLAGSAWLRIYAILAAVVGLGLVAVDVTAFHEPDAPGVIVIASGAAVLAIALQDARVAVLAATAGGLAGILVAAPLAGAARAAFVGARELRAIAIAGTLAILATAWLARPVGEIATQPAVFGLAYLAFGVAVAVRFGAIPFHQWAARVADAAPGVALPLLMAWLPAAFAAVALVWIDQSVALIALPLGTERALIAAVGTVSIVLGLVAAWIQDDLEHVVGYSIVADAGVALLGLAVLDPAGWEPARTWLLVFVVARSAFAAWVVAIHGGFGTRRLPELAGWARRAPVLAIALVAITAASIGWPGLTSWDARSALIDLALPRPMASLVTIAPIGALAIYGRILLVGFGQPRDVVLEGRSERPRWPTPLPRRPMVGGPGLERGFERVAHGLSGSLDVLWVLPSAVRANRMGFAAIAVLLLSGLAFLVSGGGLGVPEAARAVPQAAASAGPTGSGSSQPPPSSPGPGSSAGPGSSESPGDGGSPTIQPSFAPVP